MNATENPPSYPAFEIHLRVQQEDIDELLHVNNVVYLRWVQDAAIAHWRSAATPEQQAEVIWVVARHEIDYKHPARAGDEIIARTWVGKAAARLFERHTELLRASDRRLLARARTLWCPIEWPSRKPKRVSAELRARFSVPGELEVDRTGSTLES